jgi:hypothetical protein
MKKYIPVFLFLSFILYSAKINLDNEIKNIPAKIQNILSIGKWVYNKQTGYYRVIHIESYNGCSLLYIQWLINNKSSNYNQKILHTLSIKEFNADDHIELTFPMPRIVKLKNSIKIYITAESGHDDQEHSYEIDILSQFGKYKFKKIK